MNSARDGRGWPAYLPGGRIRTSTFALIVAFLATWWLYETYEPAPAPPPQVPASEVVPPGFIPDPAYTWAPRTDVQRRTETPTTTSPTTPTTPTSGEPTPTSGAPGEPPVSPGASPTTTTSPAPLPPGAPSPSPTAPPASPSLPAPTPSPGATTPVPTP